MALASCSATTALPPATVMYSGSKSMSAKLRRALPWVGTPAKPGLAMTDRLAMSMMLTLPTGSMPPPIEPSLATNSLVPSGVKVSMSGRAPTPMLFTPLASARVVVSNSLTLPGSVRTGACRATAARPSWMAMLLASPHRLVSMCWTRPPVCRSSTSMPLTPTTHRVCVRASKATISKV